MDNRTLFWIVVCSFVLLKVVTSLDCTGKPDGIYEKSCRSFSKCVNETYEIVICEQQSNRKTAFNKDTGTCDDAFNVPPPCGVYRECSALVDGGYPDLDQMCMSYYSCSNGMFLGHYICPPGLVFNHGLQVCDWPFNVSQPCGILPPTHRSRSTRLKDLLFDDFKFHDLLFLNNNYIKRL